MKLAKKSESDKGSPALGISVHKSSPRGVDEKPALRKRTFSQIAHMSRASVRFFESGVLTHVPAGKAFSKKGGEIGAKRGKIKGWSKASRARLRRWLLTMESDGPVQSVSMTVAGSILSPEEWRDLATVFWRRVAARRIACVWRIELQERGQPHYHVVCWGGAGEQLAAMWFEAVRGLGDDMILTKGGGVLRCNRVALRGALEHMVEVEPMTGAGWWRYLCDHTSKKKQAQLGWEGRQWGIVSKALFRHREGYTVNLVGREWIVFFRLMRRLTRSGSMRGARGSSVWFSSPMTVQRMVDWARHVCPPAPRAVALGRRDDDLY